jgi:hypothetical protein
MCLRFSAWGKLSPVAEFFQQTVNPKSFAEKPLPPTTHSRVKMSAMAKKTGISDSSLWIVTVVLLVLTAWMYFKR